MQQKKAIITIDDNDYTFDKLRLIIFEQYMFGHSCTITLAGDEKKCSWCNEYDHLRRDCGQGRSQSYAKVLKCAQDTDEKLNQMKLDRKTNAHVSTLSYQRIRVAKANQHIN